MSTSQGSTLHALVGILIGLIIGALLGVFVGSSVFVKTSTVTSVSTYTTATASLVTTTSTSTTTYTSTTTTTTTSTTTYAYTTTSTTTSTATITTTSTMVATTTVTSTSIIYSKVYGMPSVSLGNVYASDNGYIVTLIIRNPANYTQYLYSVNASVPYYGVFSLSAHLSKPILVIPPLSTVKVPIIVYLNNTGEGISVFALGYEIGTHVFQGTYSSSSIIGSTVSIAYIYNNQTYNNTFTINNINSLTTPLIAYTYYSLSSSSVYVEFLASQPFQIVSYSLISPDGSVLLTCPSVDTITQEGKYMIIINASSSHYITIMNFTYYTVSNYIPAVGGVLELPLSQMWNTYINNYFTISSFSTSLTELLRGLFIYPGLNFIINATSCTASMTMPSYPVMGYSIELQYRLINGQSGSITIPMYPYTVPYMQS